LEKIEDRLEESREIKAIKIQSRIDDKLVGAMLDFLQTNNTMFYRRPGQNSGRRAVPHVFVGGVEKKVAVNAEHSRH